MMTAHDFGVLLAGITAIAALVMFVAYIPVWLRARRDGGPPRPHRFTSDANRNRCACALVRAMYDEMSRVTNSDVDMAFRMLEALGLDDRAREMARCLFMDFALEDEAKRHQRAMDELFADKAGPAQ